MRRRAQFIKGASLPELMRLCYRISYEHGFHDQPRSTDIERHILLMIGELVEAHEEMRSGRRLDEVYYNPDKPGKPEGVPVELADTLIRLLDNLMALEIEFGIDFADIIAEKLDYNESRPRLHGREF